MANKFTFGKQEFGSGSAFGQNTSKQGFGGGSVFGQNTKQTGAGESRAPSVDFDKLEGEEKTTFAKKFKESIDNGMSEEDSYLAAEDGLFTFRNERESIIPTLGRALGLNWDNGIDVFGLHLGPKNNSPTMEFDKMTGEDQTDYARAFKDKIDQGGDENSAYKAGEDAIRNKYANYQDTRYSADLTRLFGGNLDEYNRLTAEQQNALLAAWDEGGFRSMEDRLNGTLLQPGIRQQAQQPAQKQGDTSSGNIWRTIQAINAYENREGEDNRDWMTAQEEQKYERQKELLQAYMSGEASSQAVRNDVIDIINEWNAKTPKEEPRPTIEEMDQKIGFNWNDKWRLPSVQDILDNKANEEAERAAQAPIEAGDVEARYNRILGEIGGLNNIQDAGLRKKAQEVQDAFDYINQGKGTYQLTQEDLRKYSDTLRTLQDYRDATDPLTGLERQNPGFAAAAEEAGYDHEVFSQLTKEAQDSALQAYREGGAEGFAAWDGPGGEAEKLYDAGKLWRPEGEALWTPEEEKKNFFQMTVEEVQQLFRDYAAQNTVSMMHALAGRADETPKLDTPALDKFNQIGKDFQNWSQDVMNGALDTAEMMAHGAGAGVAGAVNNTISFVKGLADLGVRWGLQFSDKLTGLNVSKNDQLVNLARGIVMKPYEKAGSAVGKAESEMWESSQMFRDRVAPGVKDFLVKLGMDDQLAQGVSDKVLEALQEGSRMYGNMAPSLLAGWMCGGPMMEGTEISGIVGRVIQSVARPDFVTLFMQETGDAMEQAYAKYGDSVTAADLVFSMGSGAVNAIIENYETKWGFGNGVQAIANLGRAPKIGELLGGTVSEIGEEMKQHFAGYGFENLADLYNGRPLSHALDTTTKDSLFNVADYLDIMSTTAVSTLGMNVIAGATSGASGYFRRSIENAINGKATPQEMEAAKKVIEAVTADAVDQANAATVTTPTTEDQHDAFEAAAAGGDQKKHTGVDQRAQAEARKESPRGERPVLETDAPIRNEEAADSNRLDQQETDVRAAELRMREAQAAETQAIIASGNQNVQAEERARLEQEAREAIARRQAAEAEYRRAQAAASAAVNNQNEQVTTRQQQEQQAADALLEEAAKKELRLRKAQEALERAEAAANQQGQQAKERKEAEKRAGIARRQLQRAQEAYNEAMKAVEEQDRQADERKAAEEAARNDISQRNDLLQSELDQTNRNAQDVIFDQDRQVTERDQLEQEARAAEMRLREAQSAETQAIIASGDQSVQAEERARLEQEARDAIARRQAAEEEYRRAQEAVSAAVQDQKDQAAERQEQEQKAEEQIEQGKRNDEARTQAGREAAEQAAQAQEDQAAARGVTEEQAKQNRRNDEARSQAAREAAEQEAQAQTDQAAMRREAEKTAEDNTEVEAQAATQAQEEPAGTETEQQNEQPAGEVPAQQTVQETEQQPAQETAQQPAQETEQQRRRTADDINRRYWFNQRKADGDKTKYQPGLTVNTWDGDVNEQTRTELQVIHEYAREHGFAVVMDSTIRPDGVKGVVNGFYSRNEDGGLVIHLAQDGKAPLRTTLGHELYHMISNLNKNGAQRIEKLYRDFAGRQGVDIEALVTKKLEAYRNMGVIAKDDNSARARAMALEEVIADSMYDVIGDERTLRVLAMEDRGTVERIRDWAERVLRDIRRMIDKYGANKAEARVLQDQADAMENMRAAIERALAETKELQDAKKAAKSLGSNSEMMNDWHRAMDAATTREEMNAATQALAAEVLAKGGIDQNMDNVRTLLTASLEYASGGGVISQVLNEYGMNTWIPSEEANRAFVSMGRYMKQMLESQDEAGYAQLMGWEEQAEAQYSAQKFSLSERFDDAKKNIDDQLPQTISEITEEGYRVANELRTLERQKSQYSKSEEYQELLKKINTSDDMDAVIQEMKELEDKNNIPQMTERINELKEQRKKLSEQEDALRAQELEKAIQDSGKSEADFFRDKAVKEFGYTPYYYDAGYILPNGKMLNFFGEKGKHFGSRGQDHRAIGTIFEGVLEQTESLNEFVNQGNVRIMDESPGIDISLETPLTKEQIATIRQHIRKHMADGEYYVDFTGPDGRTYFSMEYLDDNVKLSKIISDIEYVQKNKEKPYRSEIADFHTMYSVSPEQSERDKAYQQAVDSGNVEEQQRLVDQAAKEAGLETATAFHGTEKFGFTEFDMEMGGETIFVAYKSDISKTYGQNLEVRDIGKLPSEIKKLNQGDAEYISKELEKAVLSDPTTRRVLNDYKVKSYETYEDYLKEIAIISNEELAAFPEETRNTVKPMLDEYFYGNKNNKLRTGISDILYDASYSEEVDNMSDDDRNKVFRARELLDRILLGATNLAGDGRMYIGKRTYYNGRTDYDYFNDELAKNHIKNAIYTGGIYKLYTRPGKQLVVDAKGKNWNLIEPEWDKSGKYWKTREIAEYAKKHGYDSVRINNVYDHGGMWGDKEAGHGDIGIFFRQEDVRSADPITYDDSGNPIPPSERFSDRKDFRYSATQGTEENDHVRYAMDADDARDMTDLGSDIARTSNVGWQLIDTLRQMKMRQTQDADGNVQRTSGYWKKQTAEIAKSLTEFTFGKDQKTIEKAVRELFTDLDEYEGDARGFVDYALRQAQGTMRDLYTDETENPTRENLKAFFEKYGPLYITPEQKKELQYYAGGMTAFRRQAAGLVPITNKKSAIGLEEVWEELAPLIGKDPSIVSVGTMIMEFNDAVEKARSVNGEERTLTDEEMAVLDRRALDLVAEYMEAGATVVPTRTVEKIDADRHQQALKEVSRLQEETDRQQEEIGRLTRRLEDADNVNQSLNRQLFSRAAELDELKKSNATRAEIDQARTAYREAAAQTDEAVKAMKDLQKKLEAARAKRDEYRSQLRQANRAEQQFEKAQHQIERLKAGRENLKKQIEQMKLKAMDARLINRQTKERNQHLNNIRKTGGALRAMFSSPSEKKGYIPMDQVRVAADLVESLVDADKGGNAAKMSKRLENALRDARESTDYQTSTMYDEGLYRDMQDVTRLLEDKGSLRNLSGSELAFVDGTLTSIVYQIKTSNETVGRQKNQALQEEAEDAVKVMRENPKDLNGLSRMIRKGMLTHLNPQRFYAILGHHGNNAWTRMGEEQSEGQRKANMLTMNMTKTFEGLTQGENEKKFDKFTGKNATWYDTGIQILTETGQDSGRTWKMNGAMRAFFGLSWQSEENREAMRAVGEKGDGGKTLYQLTIPDEELMKRGKEKEAYARGERVYFTAEQAEQIVDDLTDYEKAWMNAWKNMEKLSKNAINETSLQLNGFRKANVNNYVPIFRDPRYIGKEFESVVTDARLTSMGFLKERVNAHNPMMLMDLTNVINRQVRDVSAYYGFAIPTRNATRIYNGKMPGNATSVKEVINKTQGMEYGQYFEKLMSDLQGGSRVESSFLDRLRGNVAGATLSGNPSVIIKQAASYPAAASVLGWGPLMKGMKYFNPAGLKKINVDEIDQYTSALWERRSRSLSDLEANANRNTAMSKFVHKMANGIQGMDIATTKVIWKAAEYYVDEHSPDLKRGTEAYNNAVARIYEQALEQTQPEYGTMQRPQILRSTNQLVKSLTMYKTQSMQNFGILVDAAYNLSDKAKAVKANNSAENQAALRTAKAQMATAVSSQITSAVILGVMTALGRALLHKMSGYRDDKGDLTAESVGGQILKDSVSSVAGMVAGGSELFDLINGLIEGQSPFDIEAAGVSTINDLYQNLYGFGEAMKALADKDLTDEQKMSQVWPKLRKMGLSIAQLRGIPAGNFLNLLDGIAANAADFATGKAGSFAGASPLQIAGTALIGSAQGRETSNKAVAGYIAQAMMAGNQAEAVRLYNEQLRQGKTADALNTAIATWQKENIPEIRQAAEAIESGDISEYNRLINQLTEMGLSMTNAVKYVEAERKKNEKSGELRVESGANSPMSYQDIVAGMTKATNTSEKNVYTNGMMNSLLEDGNVAAALAVKDDMLKNGNKKLSAINSSLTSFWKPRIQEAYANGDMEEVRRITNMLVQMGMKRTTITGWTSNTKSTSSSSSKKSGFGSGSFGSGGFGSSKKSSSKKKTGFGSGSFGSGSFGK